MIAEILTMVGVGLMIGFSQAAGIGGGTRSNLILMIGMGLQAKQSIALSYVLIIGGSLGSIFQNYGKRHPVTNQKLLNWDLAILSLPMVSSGAMLGTMLQNFLSQFLISAFFIIYSIWFILRIIRKIYVSRKQKKQKQNQENKSSLISENQIVRDTRSENSVNAHAKKQKYIILNTNFTLCKGFLIIHFFIFSLAAILVKGTVKIHSIVGFQLCSPFTYAVLTLNIFISVVFVLIFSRILLENKFYTKQEAEIAPEKMKITWKGLISTTISSFISGTASATVGIGGIIFLMPVWLKFKFSKEAIASTTPIIMLYTCTTSMLMAFLNQAYSDEYLIPVCFAVGIIGSVLVKSVVDRLIRKLKIDDCIYIMLVILTSITLGIVIPSQVRSFIADPKSFISFGFFC